MKSRGENDPFKIIDMSEIVDTDRIPSFDYSVKWKIKEDRPPRRKITPVSSSRNRLTRQHSANSNDNADNKRQRSKEDMAMDVSNSDREAHTSASRKEADETL